MQKSILLKSIVMKKILVVFIMLFGVQLVWSQSSEANGNVLFERVVKAVEEGKFVFEAERVKGETGAFHDVNPQRNFISVNDNEGIMQFYTVWKSEHRKLDTKKGEVSDIKIKKDKRGNLVVNLQIKGKVPVVRLEISIEKDSNRGEVRVKSTHAYPSLTLVGKLLPLSESKIAVGLDSEGW